MTDTKLKNNHLRNNEYYDVQQDFDELYSQSKNNQNFYHLMKLITSEENIKLAYRNIKKNSGSSTSGTNGHNIETIAKLGATDYVKYVRKRLENYQPQSVKRVMIPKSNGKMRPLGIPTIEDRLIQQCIKQVLEPICEAKFYPYSFGFRPNRSTKHAISRCYHLMQKTETHYVVDVDIKSFFDNVDPAKLIKQMWTLGIKDKALLSIISKLLKAEIQGEGVPSKGTPQGGVLSPLLSNIVLNELDWWIHSQFDGMITRSEPAKHDKNMRDRMLKKYSKLKEVHIVRYADDFKIFCRSYQDAKRIKAAVVKWLQERLNLEVAEDKTRITNLRHNYSDFLGIKLKVHPKGKKKNGKIKYVVKSRLNDKSMDKFKNGLLTAIKEIKHSKSKELPKAIGLYNAKIMGYHNYYNVATHCSKDFHELDYLTLKARKNRFEDLKTSSGHASKALIKHCNKDMKSLKYISGMAILSIAKVSNKPPMQFNQVITNYTKEGRKVIHDTLGGSLSLRVVRVMRNPVYGESIEYNDNRVSLFTGQEGKCAITNVPIDVENMHCHHKKPRHKGGTDEYKNLMLVHADVHRLLHSVKSEVIEKYKSKLALTNEQLAKINQYRKTCDLKPI